MLCALYFLQAIILPVAVAALITFVLSPAAVLARKVTRADFLGVSSRVVVAFTVIGILTWISAVQILDLAWKLPTYKANLTAKMQALNSSGTGPFAGHFANAARTSNRMWR